MTCDCPRVDDWEPGHVHVTYVQHFEECRAWEEELE